MVNDFKKLEIWDEAYRLALDVYTITKKFPKDELFALTNQIRRATVSVAANIAESYGRFGIKDKVQLLLIARGSIFETRSHLAIGLGLGYLTKEEFDTLDGRYETLTKRLNAYIMHVRSIKPASPKQPSN